MAQLGTRLLQLTVDGTDFTGQISACSIESAEADSGFLDFASAANGANREYTLTGTIVQDTAAGTLWREIWDNVGDIVPIIVKPAGGTTPTAANPHFSGSVVISEPDGPILGGEADVSTSARFTTDIAWKFTARPTLLTGA